MRTFPALVSVAAALMLGACAQPGAGRAITTAAITPPAAEPAKAAAPTELEAATAHWGKEFSQSPRNLEAALAYAKNLKAMGQKRQALAVLQQAATFHANDRRLASEYGRLALEFDQLALAKQLLEAADDPAEPDWRVVLARGTVLAKEGRYKDAIPYYERAQALAHDHPSVLNNLALAYAMSGEADKAEALLRRAAAAGDNPKVRQNLALVLGLRGSFDEAKSVAARDLSPEQAAADTEFLRRMVKLDPAARHVAKTGSAPVAKPASLASGGGATGDWTPQVALAVEAPLTAPERR